MLMPSMLGTRKRDALDYIYSTSPVKNTAVIALAGPNVNEVIEDVMMIEPTRICLYDIVPEFLPKSEGIIESYNTDVFFAEPSRYMDLDFCASIKSTSKRIQHLFKAQRKYKSTCVFTFTASIRESWHMQDFLNDLLGVELKFYSDKIHSFNRRVYETDNLFVEWLSYRDSAAMYLIRIIC